MKSINHVQLLWNITDNPEVKVFNGDKKMVKFTLATNKSYKNKDGEFESIPSYHRCVSFNEYVVKDMEKRVSKWDALMIEGTIKYGSYEKNGEKYYTTDIVIEDWSGYNYIWRLLKSGENNTQTHRDNSSAANNRNKATRWASAYNDDISIEDIPF